MKLDQQQTFVQKNLKQLAQVLNTEIAKNIIVKIFTKKDHHIKSIYIWGGVGRGKSMLMKEFYNSIKHQPKIYIHFNSFMRKIHEALRDIRKEQKKYKDELIEAVKRVAQDKNKNFVKLICFDEFQVTDIADAMLLARIFSYLFSQNVVAIFTSNSPPLELYKNGLQRELFLQFVNNVLLKNCQVLFLDSPTDYREKIALLEKTQNISNFEITKRYFIANEKNHLLVQNIIKNIVKKQPPKPLKLKVWGREIKIKETYNKIAVISFSDLCQNNYAASDYQAICQKFDLIFLLQIPKLTVENLNEARRFIIFIDEVYESKISLIFTSQVKINEIYTSGIGVEAFKRTISRLKEIKTDLYWQNSKFLTK